MEFKLWPLLRSNLALILAVSAAILGITIKLFLTSGALLPGLDGAFYWVQVRSILAGNGLAFDDLPLVFYGQAGLAALVGDIPTAVRISDAVLPALSAVPLYLMTRSARNPLVPGLTILAVLAFPVQLFFFTGDFIKNAAAIPFVFFIGWLLSNWKIHSARFTYTWLTVAYVALALTHFGTLLMGLMVGFLWLVMQLRTRGPKFWLVATAISAGAISIVLVLLWVLVPARFERLIGFVSSADVVFSNPAILGLLRGNAWPVMIFTILFCQIASVIAAWMVYKNRQNFSGSNFSVAIASITTALLLSSPLIGGEWSDRLAALAFAPLAIALSLINEVSPFKWHKVSLVSTVVLLLGASVFLAPTAKRAVLSDSDYHNFQNFASKVALSENSVVVASHGLEYLSAWEMKTDVLEDTFYADTDLSSYTSVYYLSRKNTAAPSYGGYGYLGYAAGFYGYGAGSTKPADFTGDLVLENDSFKLIKIR